MITESKDSETKRGEEPCVVERLDARRNRGLAEVTERLYKDLTKCRPAK
jgi:hypothetical protein